MNRRGFLKLGLAGGAVLAVGAAGLALWPSARRFAPREKLVVLDERSFGILAAAVTRLAPPDADAVDVAHRVDQTLALGPVENGHDFKRLLATLESALVGLFLDGRARPFTRLDGAAQDLALERWRDSHLLVRRSGYTALRKLVVGAFYSDPKNWARTGYPGPPAFHLPPGWTNE